MILIFYRFFSHDVILWKKKKRMKIHSDKERVPYKYTWLLTHFIICYHPSCSVVIQRKRQTWTKIIHSVVSSFLAFFSEEARDQQSHTESRKAISITRGYKKESLRKDVHFLRKEKERGTQLSVWVTSAAWNLAGWIKSIFVDRSAPAKGLEQL